MVTSLRDSAEVGLRTSPKMESDRNFVLLARALRLRRARDSPASLTVGPVALIF